MKILIVEDESTALARLETFLLEFGEIDTARDGVEAIEKIESALEAGEHYTVIFLDIQMPKMDGHEVLSKMREMELDRRVQDPAKVIMTTISDNMETVINSFSERCDAYIIKPVKREEIVQKLNWMGLG